MDKWDFVAFALGGEEARQPLELWRARREKATLGKARVKNSVGLWSHKALVRGRVNRGGQRSTQGVLRRSGRRVLRVLSLCNGCGSASLALEQLRITADVEVVFVEIDEDCRAFTQWRFPAECGGWSSDVRDWASSEFEVNKGDEQYWFDLVVAGFPCQDLSVANRQGKGLQGGKSGLFFDIWSVVNKLRVVNPALHTVLECVDFQPKFPVQFELVGTTVGVQPVRLCASRIGPCYRRRAFWNSFAVGQLQFDPAATPASVLEAGRWSDQPKLPTLVASGTNSWNTRAVVFDEQCGGQAAVKQPLRAVEMERCQGMPDNFTDMPGFNERTRHHMIGNSFHVGVIKHIFRAWIVLLREFDSTLGYPGEGPTWEQRQRGLQLQKAARAMEAMEGEVVRRQPASVTVRSVSYSKREVKAQGVFGAVEVSAANIGISESLSEPGKRGGKRQPGWCAVLPESKQQCVGVSLAGLFDTFEWGSSKRAVLPARASKQKLGVPVGDSFRAVVDDMVRDLVLSSRADSTWKAYKAWVEVFGAFLGKFGLDSTPAERYWDQWIEVLVIAVAVLSQCYSLGTIGVFVSAVSACLQDHELRSPFESRLFAAVMKGLPRYLGVGKAKKPPVEAWQVALIVGLSEVQGFTTLQRIQAIAVLLVGWHLFTRSQDFAEFQACDFVQLREGMRVLVRYAKDDQKGLTRMPVLAMAEDSRACPVRSYRSYVAIAGITVQPGCTKVEGEPQRCTVCPVAFPSIGKHKGKMHRAMPKSRVTEILRVFYLVLADQGHMTEAEARAFSSKSLRCGGVSAASAECVRDGVLQGHGGWLHRQSLVHYDVMREGERTEVSTALGKAVGVWLH